MFCATRFAVSVALVRRILRLVVDVRADWTPDAVHFSAQRTRRRMCVSRTWSADSSRESIPSDMRCRGDIQ